MKEPPFYFKNLDGLRAVAAFSVIFFHTSAWFDYPQTKFYNILRFTFSFGGNGGALGVTFFFILSGFLITYLMFKEYSDNGSFNIPFFYFRRVIRIWPLYYMTLFAGFVVFPLFNVLQGEIYNENASVFLYSIFAVNFDHIYNGDPSTGILGVQWSVAIEEQFYLMWPIVFFLFNKKNIFPYVLILIITISELFFLTSPNWSVGYYHLISNLRFLAFGGLLAFLCYFKRNHVEFFLNKINRFFSFLIYVASISLMLFQYYISKNVPGSMYVYHILPFLFFGFVIVEQNFSNNSFYKIGSYKFLTWLAHIAAKTQKKCPKTGFFDYLFV